MWKSTVLRGLFFSKVVRISYLLNGWGKEFWRSARGWTGWALDIINLNVHFFLRVREFFILHRMVGRAWRGVLIPGYLEPCNLPSVPKIILTSDVKCKPRGPQDQPQVLQFYRTVLVFCCCFCSTVQSCLTLCNPVNCSAPGFPILQYVPEFPQTHVH